MENQFGNQPSSEEVTKAEEMMTEEQKEASEERGTTFNNGSETVVKSEQHEREKEKREKMIERLKMDIGETYEYGPRYMFKLKDGSTINFHKIIEVRDDEVVLEKRYSYKEIESSGSYYWKGADIFYSSGHHAGERVKEENKPVNIIKIPFKEIDGLVFQGSM